MEVHLLRDLIDTALAEPNQETQIGVFACYAPDYDDEVPLFKALFFSKTAVSIISEELTIVKSSEKFVVTDRHGETDVFTYQEISLLIFLWDEPFKIKISLIIMD